MLSSAHAHYGAVIVRSDNVHEIRGYNLAARRATASISFSQDDRIPPPALCPNGSGGLSPCWVTSILAIFRDEAMRNLRAVGLHRGRSDLWTEERTPLIGTCGDANDDTTGHKWTALFTRRMTTPIEFAAQLNIGPIVVRRQAFQQLGGFNVSYSRPGQMGIGFDFEFTTKLWTWMAGRSGVPFGPDGFPKWLRRQGQRGATYRAAALAGRAFDLYHGQFYTRWGHSYANVWR